MCFFTLPFDSNLSIQNASFTIPDGSESDQRLDQTILKLTKYCLERVVSKRPDIYQVSTLVWSESNSPITNKNKSRVPVISNLKLPLTESQLEKIKLESRKSGQTLNIHSTGSQQTSINPRQRPEDLHNNTPSVEAVMMELQKRTGSGQNLKSVQVYTVLEKLLP